MVVEQLALGLKEHEAPLLQLEAVDAARVAAVFDHCNNAPPQAGEAGTFTTDSTVHSHSLCRLSNDQPANQPTTDQPTDRQAANLPAGVYLLLTRLSNDQPTNH